MVKFASEEWKQIMYKGEFRNYEASTLGRVRNLKTGYVLTQHTSKEKYLRISLQIYGKHKLCQAHRLIASTFKPNPNNLKYVNHIDLNR